MKYLLWDFDNTLAYRDGMWSSTIHNLLLDYGYTNFKLEDVRPYLKTGFPWNFPELSHEEFFNGKQWWEHMSSHFCNILREIGIEADVAKSISDNIREKYLTPDKWYLYDDTISCLKISLERGYSNIVISNHVPELQELINALGISDYFIKVYSSAHVGFEKPNKKIYETAIMSLEDPESITMIGDNYFADVQGAKKAGIDAILVRKPNDYNYDKYFTTLKELADFI
ncbi:HAD family hydrolase [Clostridium cellulovorans]|uniref:HAD-superfamily hydrolase, subfamily IA, variant 1 n=1 Tax=Clostridium cellulovorans (strain ATCC 35296 / DSM 3052 / OCM 3 / 743B) TaxID=573061 RepID=D9SPL9_CLOC7|nr:HAD-IA family hydrolase [Clostridium cellulovorans]ADL50068.1 HAD-superfamily hydrolase, subfamily IA, variant 1 [Clostridium cellulovorans 743B]